VCVHHFVEFVQNHGNKFSSYPQINVRFVVFLFVLVCVCVCVCMSKKEKIFISLTPDYTTRCPVSMTAEQEEVNPSSHRKVDRMREESNESGKQTDFGWQVQV